MKFLELDPDDHLLFDGDIAELAKNQHLIIHFKDFKSMFITQGETFWLRFILTLRYYYYKHHFLNEAEKYRNLCASVIIDTVECSFVHICMFFVKKGTLVRAFKLLRCIFAFVNASYEMDDSKDEWVNFHELLEKKFKDLGMCVPHSYSDKNSQKRYTLQIQCFLRFYYSICNLLERFKALERMPIPSNSDKPYWQPFQVWFDKNFIPSLFDAYIVSQWGDELMEKLLITPDIISIFKERTMHFCSILEEKYIDTFGLFGGLCSFGQHSLCSIHKNCYERISHDINCKTPHFCFDCRLTCDTEIMEKLNKLSKNSSCFWKTLDCEHYPNSKSNFKDVSIQTDSLYNSIDTYSLENLHEEFVEPPGSIHPKLKNSVNHFQRKLEAKFRLREKLRKKQKKNIRPEEYDSLYKSAKNRVEKFFDYLNKFSYIKDYYGFFEHLPSLKKFLEESISSVQKHKNFTKETRSIGIGYDGILHVTFIDETEICCSHRKISKLSRPVYNKSLPSYITGGCVNFESNFKTNDNSVCEISRKVSIASQTNLVFEKLSDKISCHLSSSKARNQTPCSKEKNEQVSISPGNSVKTDSKQDDLKRKSEISATPIWKFCAFCGMIEKQKKSFKKCGQCKIDNFEPMHYYCSKECQAEDWKKNS